MTPSLSRRGFLCGVIGAGLVAAGIRLGLSPEPPDLAALPASHKIVRFNGKYLWPFFANGMKVVARDGDSILVEMPV